VQTQCQQDEKESCHTHDSVGNEMSRIAMESMMGGEGFWSVPK
jgi:hypothetical protein